MRNWSENQVTLVLIRHGETQANGERRYLGKTDELLSGRGRENLLSYKEKKLYPKVNHLFVSPMKRCLETAQILYPKLEPSVIPEWEEIDFGRFEYKNYEDLKDDASYQSWIGSKGMADFPGGESRKSFILRCEKGFYRMCKQLQVTAEKESGPICAGVIVHGGTIMALLSSYGGYSYFDSQVLNGRGYVCRMMGWGSSAQIEEVKKI